MKLFINYLLFFILPFNSFAQECKSKIVVQSDSDSVYVFINDSLITKTKSSSIELPNGRYEIKLVGDNKIWNSNITDDIITLRDCDSIMVKYNSVYGNYIDSNPQDAYVFIGDSLIGNTPMFLNSFIKEVTIKKDGFRDYSLSDLKAGNNVKVNLEFIGVQKEKSFFSSTAFKVLAGSALALGAASAYFKLKADNKFDEYKLNKDKLLLDQTNKYDLISGITFTALQINLGFIIYKLFSE